MNGVHEVDKELFFKLNKGERRGHNKKLYKRRFGLDVRKYFSVTEL